MSTSSEHQQIVLPEVRTEVGLRWKDIDVLGHVNQAVYHVLLEEVRTKLLAGIVQHGKVGWVLVHTELDHRREIRRDADVVECRARVTRVGTRSITVANEIYLRDGTLCAEGSVVLAGWDPEARGGREISAEERRVILGDGA